MYQIQKMEFDLMKNKMSLQMQVPSSGIAMIPCKVIKVSLFDKRIRLGSRIHRNKSLMKSAGFFFTKEAGYVSSAHFIAHHSPFCIVFLNTL